MSNFVEDIISELEFTFSDKPSARNSVQCLGGETVRLEKTLCDASPVMKAHHLESSSFLKICAPKSTVEELIEAQRSGEFPSDFPNLLNLFALCGQLALDELASVCFDRLTEIEGFTERDFPSECSSEAVMEFLNLLLRTPLRTADIYKRQIARIAKHCGNNQDIMTNAVNLVREKLEAILAPELQGIPIDFDRRSVPILIYEALGRTYTAVLDRHQLKHLEVFGRHSKNSEILTMEDSFLLKHGSYVIFKSGNKVYRKDLGNDSDPAEILRECSLLLTRGRNVFAVQDKDDYSSVMLFTADSGFVTILEKIDKIKVMDFECDEGILAIKLLEGPVLFFLRTGRLSFTLSHKKDFKDVKDLILVWKKMFILTERDDRLFRTIPSRLDMYPICPDANPSTPETSNELGKCEVAIKKFGNTFFLLQSGELHIMEKFPSHHKLISLPCVEKLSAISELSMFF